MGYKSFASGILVESGKILLVHHNKFDKWVFPGGHIESDETPNQAAIREFFEETGISCSVLSSGRRAFAGDDNDTPLPLPFYMGLAKEGFDVPHVGYYYYMRPLTEITEMRHQKTELFGIEWYKVDDLPHLKTFEQA